MAGLFEELKRRNVFRVGVAYVIVAWLILQFTDLVLENVNAPDWVMKVIMLVLVVGLPVALIFAWAFEMTPEGVKREKDVDRSKSHTPQTGKKLDRLIIAVLVLVFALAIVGIERVFFAGSSESKVTSEQVLAAEKSIAVLPFADLSQNQDQEWFADGLAEEILNALTRTPDLLVSSRTSAFAYKGTTKDVPTIASELGVAHILEGSVRQAGDRIRVTAQLIRASDGFHVWSENYDRNSGDVISIQEDLAVQIAMALQTTMDPAALADMARVGTRSTEAYQNYIRGVTTQSESLEQQSPELFVESNGFFERAIEYDPSFSAAYAGAASFWKLQLSPTWAMSGGIDLPMPQMLDAFRSQIDKAIESATNRDDRTFLRAEQATVEMRLETAIKLYEDYLRNRPNELAAWESLLIAAELASDKRAASEALIYLRIAGKTEYRAAQAYMQSAYKYVDPSIAADYGLAAIERWPNRLNLMYQTHRTLLWAGRTDDAALVANQFPDGGNQDLLKFRQACAEGRRESARKMAGQRLTAPFGDDGVEWHFALIYGNTERAISLLRPYESREVPYVIASWLIYAQFDPSPFPVLMEILERENIDRPPAVEIPFACPPE